MPDTTDLLGFAIDKNPVDFADSVNSILQSKALDALDAKRIELAQSIYGDDEQIAADEAQPEFDFSEDELAAVDDDDLEDLDLDDLDIDLNDLDLEDNGDDE